MYDTIVTQAAAAHSRGCDNEAQRRHNTAP